MKYPTYLSERQRKRRAFGDEELEAVLYEKETCLSLSSSFHPLNLATTESKQVNTLEVSSNSPHLTSQNLSSFVDQNRSFPILDQFAKGRKIEPKISPKLPKINITPETISKTDLFVGTGSHPSRNLFTGIPPFLPFPYPNPNLRPFPYLPEAFLMNLLIGQATKIPYQNVLRPRTNPTNSASETLPSRLLQMSIARQFSSHPSDPPSSCPPKRDSPASPTATSKGFDGGGSDAVSAFSAFSAVPSTSSKTEEKNLYSRPNLLTSHLSAFSQVNQREDNEFDSLGAKLTSGQQSESSQPTSGNQRSKISFSVDSIIGNKRV